MANYTQNHQLGNRDEQGDLRPRARTESRNLEVRPRLGRRNAAPEERATDAHHQRQIFMVHRRRRPASGGSAGRRRALPAGSVDESSWIHQGGPHARRKSQGTLAMGADRKGARWRRRPVWDRTLGVGKGARGGDHRAGKVPHGCHDQQSESDPAYQDHGQRERAWRLQHRARVHQSDLGRQREVADRLALPPGLGRQLAVLSPEHRPQCVRWPVPQGRAECLHRSGARS